MIGKILNLAVRDQANLEVVWDDGQRATIDLARILASHPSVAPLRDRAEFALAQLSADGWSVEWPSGVDFGAAQLRRWAEEQAVVAHGEDRAS